MMARQSKGAVVDPKNLTPEQQEKFLACKSPEDVRALCEDECLELSNEELDAISGGAGPDAQGNFICPWCREYALRLNGDGTYTCSFCGKTFDYHF